MIWVSKEGVDNEIPKSVDISSSAVERRASYTNTGGKFRDRGYAKAHIQLQKFRHASSEALRISMPTVPEAFGGD